MRPQRIGSSNCLAKTQVYAKPNGEVPTEEALLRNSAK